MPLARTDAPAVQAMLGARGLLQGVDDRGAQVMAVGRPVADSPWTVLTTIDRDEAAEDWSREQQQAAAVAVTAALAMLLGLGLLWRQQRLRLVERELVERERAEKALRAREEVFSSIVNQAMDAIVLVDGARGTFIEFNTAAHEGMGYTREEFAQLTIADLQAEHTAADIRRNMETIRQRGSLVFENRHRRRDGAIRDVRVSARMLRLQDRDCMAAMWSDVTERRHTERALQENEARFRAVFDQAVDGIMLVSADGNRMQVNTAFARMHGYDDAAQMTAVTLSDLATPTSSAHMPERLHRAMAGEVLTFDTEHYRQDRSVVPLSVAASRVRLANEWHVLAFHRDITESRRRDACRAMGQWILLILGEPGELRAVLLRMLHLVQASTAADIVELRLAPGLGLPDRVCVGGAGGTTVTPTSPTPAGDLAPPVRRDGASVGWERLADVLTAGQVPPSVRSTPGGSRWVDDLDQTTESAAAIAPLASAWRELLGGGCRTAAWVAVRAKGQVIGWLHLRIYAGGQLNRESVEALEDATRGMGEAILRRGAENELRESQELLRQAVDRAPEAILMVDAQGRVALWNDAATLLLGYPRNEALGQDVGCVAPRELFLTAAAHGADAAAGRRRSLALTARHRDGREIPIEASVARVGLHGAWGQVAILRPAGGPG
jgi:PAS domain S-box-containing protein